ncbi:MAG: AEC family transporter [Lachnospiraceae bacterium]|nr:AEC family transporter [Lachnospiraceae bacterium]
MEIFNLTLTQMLTMFLFIILGYILRKKNILSETAHLTMSRLETYIFVPCLVLYNWMNNCTVSSLKTNSILIIYGLILILSAIALAYPLSGLFVKKADTDALTYQRNIYKYAMTFGNYGFMGNFIVLGVWGSEMFFKYSMFTLCISFACYSWGLFILIPKDKNNTNILKSALKRLCTPPIIALFVGLFAGLFQVKDYLPVFVVNVMSDASKCMGPIAMLLAGVVIGGYDLKELLTYKKVYVATILRLVVIPAVMLLVLRFFGTSQEIMSLALIAFATPLGLNTVVYPAAYGGDVKTGASMSIISHTFSVITIPLMYLIFIA